ncbi:unnamed protein product, partial [Didymodactylos carnosus]
MPVRCVTKIAPAH